MKTRISGKLLLLVLLLAFGILLSGNLAYFLSLGSNSPASVAQALENTMLTFLCGPLSGPGEMYQAALQHQGPPVWLMCATALSSLVIFSVHVFLLVRLADLFLISFSDWHIRPCHVLVIGSQEHCEPLLQQIHKKMRVYYWSQSVLEPAHLRTLLKKGVTAEYRPYTTLDSDRDIQAAYRFLKRHRIGYVVLADASDAKNMQMYLTLSGCPYCETHSVQFHALCSNWDNRVILESYFDSELEQKMRGHEEFDFNPHRDLRIFSIPQVESQRMFASLPLHTVTGEKGRVRLLVIGGGRTGRAAALHAMNQAVLSDENPIRIDIADRDIASTVQALSRHLVSLDKQVFSDQGPLQAQFTVPAAIADGSLSITCSQWEVRSQAFADHLKQIQAGDDPYTYIAVCLPDPDDNLYCSYLFERLFKDVPSEAAVAFRMSRSSSMEAHLQALPWCRQVTFLGTGEEYIGLSQVVDMGQEMQIREYNRMYGLLTAAMSGDNCGDRETLWNRMQYYRRESNRALYHHRAVKDYLRDHRNSMESDFARDQWTRFLNRNAMEAATKGKENPYTCWLLSEENGKLCFPSLVAAARMEHRRFCYYMLSQGWSFTEGSNDPVRKRHSCLMNWKDLARKRPAKLIYDLISAPQMIQKAEQIHAASQPK